MSAPLSQPGYTPTLEDLLLVFRRQIVEACRKEGMRYELTFSQVEAMRFIGEYGSATMKEIAQYLKITPPSATALIAEMEKKGLMRRRASPTDRRTVMIEFTKKATAVFTKLSERKKTILSHMLEKLSEKDTKNLQRIITILITS